MVRRKYMYVLVLSVFLEVLLNLETALVAQIFSLDYR